ncbi:MAG: TatD DNase family protein, partial [Candidatus Paceibacteria bacterium]
TTVINVGTDKKTSKEVVDLAKENDNMFAVIGLHPTYEEEFDTEFFEDLIKEPKVVGVGECGLDFFRGEDGKERQIDVFRKQIELAKKYDKPLMIHCREAYPEVLEILREYKEKFGDKLRVNFHFCAATKEQLQEIIDLGFYASFTGVITFAKEYEELVRMMPMDKIMSETDSPFVTPVPHRGKRNEPVYVSEVVKKIAEIKGMDLREVREKVMGNAKEFFGV